jgi:signal recognition particle receptor subunit beta
MPYIDEDAGEIHVKIVYHGPTLAGRTTNMQYVYNKTRPEARGRFEALATETVRNMGGSMSTIATIIACDIIPLSVAPIHDRRLRLRLFTTPGSLYIEGIREQVLQDADGVVFVADSQRAREEATVEVMEALKTYVARQGRTLASLPLVLQYNKRDCPDIVPVAELDAALNPDRRPVFEAVAPTGQGVFDTLKAVVKPIVEKLRAAP